MVVDSMETMVYLGCKNKNVYWMPIDSVIDHLNQQQRKPKKVLNQQKNEITWMALTKSENRLIVGTSDGILFIYSNLSKSDLFNNLDGEEDMKPLEIHKDKGWITNIVPIMKPIWLFGLKTKIRDTTKIPFLTAEGEKKTFDKSKKQFDSDQIDEFLLPIEKLDLHKLTEGSKNFINFV